MQKIPSLPRFPFAHTFSIVARDPETGQLGVAVQSHWFSVGSIVGWAEAGIGAVATQSMVDPSYGPLGLQLLRMGKTPRQALNGLLASDSQREVRQVAILNAQGEVATHTGKRCIADAGHIEGEGFSVQANMMANSSVWPAMADAYRAAHGSLAERMMAALDAAQSAGGDIRGRQSASLLVVAPVSSGRPWSDRLIDLRIEDHEYPLVELRRLLRLQNAYVNMNKGDDLLSQGLVDQALQAYRSAAEIAPEIWELPFWHAITLAELDRLEEALPIFAEVFRAEPQWVELLKRLPAAGLLRDDPLLLQKILAVA